MQILIEEGLQRVQSEYSKGVQSKDSRLTDRHIYSCLLSGRGTVLQRKYNQNQFLSDWNYQVLPCVELIHAPLHECPCAPKGFTMLRSKFKLPAFINGIDKPLVDRVATLDSSLDFDRKEYSTFTYHKGKKFSSKKPFFFIRNGFLYLGVVTNLKAVMVYGVFYDPIEVYTYPMACEVEDCVECKCKPYQEYPFPIDGELLKACVEIAANECVEIFKQVKEDNFNNSSDDSGTQGSMIHNQNQDQ